MPDSLNLTGSAELVALGDALDGSDLAARGLSNWCSAVVIFIPGGPGRKILTSAVGLPTGEIYSASAFRNGAHVLEGCIDAMEIKPERDVRGPSKVTKAKNAAVCFYGQRPSGILSMLKFPLLNRVSISNNGGRSKGKVVSGFRIYNLAGMPMMMKLVDHAGGRHPGIDGVIELNGQRAHDSIAGAYIALKGGATLFNEKGEELTEKHLEEVLLSPTKKEFKYVISATPALGHDLLNLLDIHRHT